MLAFLSSRRVSELVHYDVRVSGNVQGVFFRQSARNKAQRLRLSGSIRLIEQDTMHIELEGEERIVKKFIKWCRKGPHLFAKVENLEAARGEYRGLAGFQIIDIAVEPQVKYAE